jgi:hypothetical protein
LSLTTGLYDFQTGERLFTQRDQDAYQLTTISLESLLETVPNPLQINFGNNLELSGFSVSERRLQQAETMELTLYWRPLKDLGIDYTFFAQVVDDDTTRWASMDLAQPTSSWSRGDTQSFTLSLRIDDHTPAGVYPVIVGVYTRDDQGGFDRLQLVTDDGRLTDDFLALTQVRVD